MIKKIILLFIVIPFFFLVGCDLFNKDKEEPKIEDIYIYNNKILYKIVDNEVVIISFSLEGLHPQSDSELVIPDTLSDLPVTKIDDNAFKEVDFLKKVTLGENVKKIGEYAFYNCVYLEEINLPESLIEIGKSSFEGCSNLEEIIIPENTNYIGMSAFSNCDKLIIKTKILNQPTEWDLLWNSSLRHVIWNYNGEIKENDEFYYYIDDNSVFILLYKENDFYHVSIPQTIDNLVVKTICNYAFANLKNSYSINLPDTITTIGDYAFSNSNIKVNIPTSVSKIGSYAFNENNSQHIIFIPSNVEVMGEKVFNLSDVSVYTYLTQQPAQWDSKWNENDNGEIRVVWNVVEQKANDIFEYVIIPDNKIIITRFISETETNVTIPSTIDGIEVLTIGDFAFYERLYLESVNIQSNIESIGYKAFSYCENVKTINLGETVQIIGSYAFEYCVNLNDIDIPNSVRVIREYAFKNCDSLEELIIPDSVQMMGNSVFVNSYTRVYCVAEFKPAGWSNDWISAWREGEYSGAVASFNYQG